MRRNNRRNNAKKERIIMFASSAFVLAALTMTGIYMKSRNVESQDNGYTIDFTALGDSTDNKYQEIAQNTDTGAAQQNQPETLEDDLDYTPMEVDSGLVEIPGLTDRVEEAQEQPLAGGLLNEAEAGVEQMPEAISEKAANETPKDTVPAETAPAETVPEEDEQEEAASQNVAVVKELHFSEENGLQKPVNGETVIPYSMDGSTYFATLDQYKYNPAVMIGAQEGASVCACAEGQVIRIFEDAEIGHAVTMDLGDGYKITYGQLNGINVSLNSYVNPGDPIASVAAPTKYYSKEGSNLYLQLTKDDIPVNPESLF